MMHLIYNNHKMRIKSSNAAFTLTELLVVIAIIALLVSILLPSLNKAKELARQAVCTSNVRSIGLGIALYATEDENNAWPYYDPNNGWWTTNAICINEWRGLGKLWGPATNYLESTSLYACPSESGKAEDLKNCDWSGTAAWIASSYSLRGWEQVHWPKTPPGKELASAGRFALVSCFMLHLPNTGYPSGPLHETGYPVLFGDGHVNFIEMPSFVETLPAVNIWSSVPLQLAWWGHADENY